MRYADGVSGCPDPEKAASEGLDNTGNTEPPVPEHPGLIPWQPGQSGNPAGRPRGSKNKTTKALDEFFEDLTDTPEYRASLAVRAVKGELPGPVETFILKKVAGDVPKDINHHAGPSLVELLHAAMKGGK